MKQRPDGASFRYAPDVLPDDGHGVRTGRTRAIHQPSTASDQP